MSPSSVADIRKEYALHSLNEEEVASEPIEQFRQWWKEAETSSIEEVNAMTLSTVNEAGWPEARTVLLKGYDEKGFVFFRLSIWNTFLVNKPILIFYIM